MTSQSTVAERHLDIAGTQTRVLEVAGEGPAILLLHGFTDSADTWRPVLAELAARNRRAVAVDMPGHGHASALQRPVLATLDRFAEAFVRAYAGDQPAVLAGNSLGGLVALRTAAAKRAPLAAIAGLGPAGLAYTRRLELMTQLAKVLDPLLKILDLLPLPGALVGRLAMRLHRRLSEGQCDESLARYYASHFRGRGTLSRLRADLIALSAAANQEPLELREISVPVLLIWGERDHLADVSGAKSLLDAVKTSRLHMLDAGHCPQLQLPREVAELLAGLPASARRDYTLERL